MDEEIVDICGASLKVHNALKSVLGLLQKFLVDHGVLHLFERKVIFICVLNIITAFNVLMQLILWCSFADPSSNSGKIIIMRSRPSVIILLK